MLDYVIVDEESNSALEKMSIDEEREHSPIGFNHEGNPVQSDHNVIICDFNWLISERFLRMCAKQSQSLPMRTRTDMCLVE